MLSIGFFVSILSETAVRDNPNESETRVSPVKTEVTGDLLR
jgi:hypothetical protein